MQHIAKMSCVVCRRARKVSRAPLGAVLVSLLSLAIPIDINALDITLSHSGGFENRLDAVAAMEHAAAIWEAVLRDPISVKIDIREVSLRELPLGAQGATFVTWYEEVYPAIYGALVADASSPDDVRAIAHLPSGHRVSFQTWDASRNVVVNDGDDHINNWILLPRANLLALGLPVEGDDFNADAEIQWSDFFLDRIFDFDRTDGIDGTDFLGVAMHEIGHALGFSSGVDTVDVVFAGFGLATPAEINEYPVVTALDLFRYSTGSSPVIDLTPGGAPYFSLDGGMTSLATFASGENFGDGWQAGHWRTGSGHGIMANLPDDAIHNLSQLDLQAMDVIGWNLAEPGDFNNDGTLNELDYAQWRATFGSVVHLAADGNRNGLVDAADYVIWRSNADTTIATNKLATVPESTDAALGVRLTVLIAYARLRIRRPFAATIRC